MRNPLKIFRRTGVLSGFLLLGALLTPSVASAENILSGIGNAVLSAVSLFILSFASALLGIFGTFFNWVVIRTVFQFGVYFGTTDGMLLAWGVMRDIANIGLLFGFIFMGVMLILNVSGGHGGGMDAKRAIPRLILFAVLLNFSLFASQGVIDVANALGAQFAGLAGLECGLEDTGKECANRGISGRVMQMAGITSIWNGGLDSNNSGLMLLMLALFVAITAMVLLAAAIMLIIRVVILTLLMVTSPIGFAGMVIPGLGGLASKWWHALISQAFFAPVMLLLMFISLKMADSMNEDGSSIVQALGGLGKGDEGTAAGVGSAGNLEILVVFAVVIGLMLASIMVASKMGAMGAKFATNSAAALTFGTMTRATNYGAGRAARAGRNYMQKSGTAALGRVGGRIGGIAGARGAALGEKLGRGTGKVLVNRALTPLEKANLDARRVPGVGGLLGLAGIDAGAKPAEHVSFAEMEHKYEDFRDGTKGKELDQQYQDQVNEKLLANEIHDMDAGKRTSLSPAAEKFLSTRTPEQFAKLHGAKGGSAALAQAATPEQFNKFIDDEKLLTPQEREAFRDARFKKLSDAVGAGDEKLIKSLLKGMTDGEKERMSSELKKNNLVLKNISDSDRKLLSKSPRYTSSEREAVKGSYLHEQIKSLYKKTERAELDAGKTAAVAAAAAAKAVISSGDLLRVKNDKVPEIDLEILMQPEIAFSLNASMLKQIGRNTENFTPADLITIGKNINRTDPDIKKYLKNNPGYG